MNVNDLIEEDEKHSNSEENNNEDKLIFYCHKAILVSKSDFFRKLLISSDNSEQDTENNNNNNVVEIEVPSIQNAKFLIDFCYCLDAKKLKQQESFSEILFLTTHKLFKLFPQNQGFSYLVNNRLFSDVKIHVMDQIIYSHKVLLCATPNWFSNTLLGNFNEAREGTIHITHPDLSHKTILFVISHLYGVQNEPQLDISIEILIASDMFLLDQLKWDVQLYISKYLDLENIRDIVELANKHNAQLLLKHCKIWLAGNLNKIKNDSNFDEVIQKMDVQNYKNEREKHFQQIPSNYGRVQKNCFLEPLTKLL